jgi:superfamily II RNA helicase
LDEQLSKNDVNKNAIVSIYLKLLELSELNPDKNGTQFNIMSELIEEYSSQLEEMNDIVDNIDIIEQQFVKYYSQMPPLNRNDFYKLDDWQIKVIKNIDNNISTVINVPTSGGKTVTAGYAVIKAKKQGGKALFVVPTDALTWQVSSYIESIIGTVVPIITESYQSSGSLLNMINILNNADCIVGTAEYIMDYCLLLKIILNG